MAQRDYTPVTNDQKISDPHETQLAAEQRLLIVLWCLYPQAFKRLQRDVFPEFVKDLIETEHFLVKGPWMWTQVGRACGPRSLVQLAGHFYYQKSLHPYVPPRFGPLFQALGYQPRAAESWEATKTRYEAAFADWRESSGFNHPWSDHIFSWVLRQWLEQPRLYNATFPALPQLIYHVDPKLIPLEEGATFSVVPELMPYMTEKQWWKLSDDLARTYAVATEQGRREFGVDKAWSPNFEALREAYFARAVRERRYRKVKEDDAFAQFAIREVEGYGYALVAEGFGLKSSTVEGHIKEVAQLLDVEVRAISGGRREGKPGHHAKGAVAHIKALRERYEQRAQQAEKLSAEWVLAPGLDFEVTLEPDPDRFLLRTTCRDKRREPLYPRLRLSGSR